MIYSEMVGRDKELDRLQLQVMKVINGEGSVVNVIGEAGIGKSRLVAELISSELIKKMTLIEGRAISIGRNLSFHLIINFLKEWTRIGESDSEEVSLSKIEVAIRQVDPEGIYEALPFVATLMGMRLSGRYAERVKGIEGEALEKLILKSVRDLLSKATGLTPLVIVAEDLHWADTSSIELLEALFHLVEKQRILFINVFRPNHKETGGRIVETIEEKLPGYYTEIKLEPLDERMGEALIRNMINIRGFKHAMIEKIVERSGGNPFFIEEVVRSFIDGGAVVIKDGIFEVTEKINKMVVPHTIYDVLMARIDRLEEKTRNLLKVASVIGRSFFYRILVEVTKAIQEIDEKLSYLEEIQLIRKSRRIEELEYIFKHALAQEAAYESLLKEKRKELHHKIADCIENVFKERLHEFYGMLAYHYSRAEFEEKSEHYLIKAGEEALKTSASREALYYYKEALNLYKSKCDEAIDPDRIAIFEKNIALALYNKGQCTEAIEYFDKVLSYYGVNSPTQPILVALKFLFCFFDLLIGLYLPFLKFKKTPTDRDKEIITLLEKKM